MFERFNLTDAADRLVGTWSGGMRRKLDVAMGLINHPRVLFLDEPTTGLDPEARAELWSEVAALSRDERARDPADHPLPRGGRPPRRPPRHRRPREDRRRRHAGGPEGRAARRRDPHRPRRPRRRPGRRVGPRRGSTGLASPRRRRRPGHRPRRPCRVPRPHRPVGARRRRRHRRDGHRRPPVARRRLPQPHRPGVPPGGPGDRPMTALAQTMYQSERHLRAFVRQPWFVAHGDHPAGDLAAAVRRPVPERHQDPGLRRGRRQLPRLPRPRRARDDRAVLVRLERHVDHRGPRPLDRRPVPGHARPPERDHRRPDDLPDGVAAHPGGDHRRPRPRPGRPLRGRPARLRRAHRCARCSSGRRSRRSPTPWR